MLEEIKIILGITNNDHDNLINLYINKITKRVLSYCNIKKFSKLSQSDKDGLNEFIEDKVISIISEKLKVTGDAENISGIDTSEKGAIKSITRGDTTITYNYNSISAKSSSSDTNYDTEFTSSEKDYLSSFIRCELLG